MLQRILTPWIFLLLLTDAEPVSAMDTVKIRINQGELMGKIAVTENGNRYQSFQGIPYAKPPVGSLRFKDPEPAGSWTGVRDASSEGSDCLQIEMLTTFPVGSEDCLFLNVYAPQSGGTPQAVMVWIHGGGFTSGSGSTTIYGPQFLMDKNVVLVTINYRLGPLGFLSTGDNVISGNMALKDQVQALRWVQDNIAAFGGDPHRVTIFGESAGGASVHYLVLSPLATGLFHRAISMSGTALNPWAFYEDCRRRAFKLGQLLGSTSTNDSHSLLAFLQQREAKELLSGWDHTVSPEEKQLKFFQFGPCAEARGTEGAFITDAPERLLEQGNFNKVPFMTGVCSNEGKLFLLPFGLMKEENLNLIDDHFEIMIGHTLKTETVTERNQVARDVRRMYFGDKKISNGTLPELSLILTDMLFFAPADSAARLTSALSEAPVYLYQFSFEGPHTPLPHLAYDGNVPIPGVQHSDDVSYIFLGKLDPANFTKGHDDDKVRQSMLTLWTNFAKTGDPNPNNTAPNCRFTPFTVNNPSFLDINVNLTMRKNLANDRLSVWRSLLHKETLARGV